MKLLHYAARKLRVHERWTQMRKRRVASPNEGACFCPCCETALPGFKTFGPFRRRNAQCPVCGALERHRLYHLYFHECTDLFDARLKRLLHVAPEPQMTALFRKVDSIDYLSADLDSPLAMVKMDITNIQYPDDSFDVIYCSHVLEHVPDDRRAMRELHRVLKPGGWGLLQVPITAKQTFEDPTVTDPEKRLVLFGQRDHVRRYGEDYKDRLREAGFLLTIDDFARRLNPATVRRFGLLPEDLYLCRKG